MNHNIFIESVLKYLASKKRFESRKTYIFGLNTYARGIINGLGSLGVFVEAILDNDQNKQGNVVLGVRTESPIFALRIFEDGRIFLIASKYYEPMKKQLEGMGYMEGSHIIKLLDSDMICSPDFISKELFSAQLDSARMGLELYKMLQEGHHKVVPVFLAPVSSIGDIFLLGLYFNQYIRKENIDEYVFLIPGGAATHIAETYGIQHVKQISMQQANSMINYELLVGEEQARIIILHSGYIHQRIVCNIIMYENMTWIENYRKFLFDLDEKTQPQKREIPRDNEKLKEIIKEWNIVKDSTVIISPYAQTLMELPILFWEGLVMALKSKGYTVLTNVSGLEKPLEGTAPVSFSLDEAEQIVEYAGTFIGLRSGLCDVISMAKCRKIILYTKEVFECIKVIDFYSLNKMGLCDDAIEIELTYNEKMDVREIMDHL